MTGISALSDEELINLLHAHAGTPLPAAQGAQFNPLDNMNPAQIFAAGAGKAVVDTGRGLRQLGSYIPGLNQLDTFNPQKVQQEIDESAATDAPLMNSAAGISGNLAGNIGMALLPGGALKAASGLTKGAQLAERLNAAGNALMAPRSISGGATLGAALGAAAPVTSTGDRMGNMALSGVLGGAVPLLSTAGNLAGAFARRGSDASTSKLAASYLNGALGNDSGAVAQTLGAVKEQIPGYLSTAAEVGGNPKLASVQRAVSKVDNTQFAQRAADQSYANKQAISGIAQDPKALAEAISSRKDITKPLYAEANLSAVPRTTELENILNRVPASIENKANTLADIAGNTEVAAPNFGFNPVTGEKMPPKISGQTLSNVEKALQDTADQTALTNTGKNEGRLLSNLRGDLLSHMDTAIPKYGEARRLFAEKSVPINQMQLGQALYNKIAPAIDDLGGNAREAANSYASALRNTESTAKNATGRNMTIEEIMNPEQMNTLNSVGHNLAGKAYASSAGGLTRPSEFNSLVSEDILSQIPGLEGIVAKQGAALLQKLPLVGKYFEGINANANTKAVQALEELLLNPQQLSVAMAGAKNTTKAAMAAEILRRISTPVAMGGAAAINGDK